MINFATNLGIGVGTDTISYSVHAGISGLKIIYSLIKKLHKRLRAYAPYIGEILKKLQKNQIKV